MSYSCTDAVDDLLNRLAIDVPEDAEDDPAEQARLMIAAIDRRDDELTALRIVAGIRKAHSHEEAARNGLELLKAARRCFQQAKARQTLARLRHTLASAYGAVRTGSYRDNRAAEAAQQQENVS